MNTKPDYQLMFLKVERDFAEKDRNILQEKLVEAKRLEDALICTHAPNSEIICAKIQIRTIEKQLHKAMDRLNELRAQVSELDWSQA